MAENDYYIETKIIKIPEKKNIIILDEYQICIHSTWNRWIKMIVKDLYFDLWKKKLQQEKKNWKALDSHYSRVYVQGKKKCSNCILPKKCISREIIANFQF